MKDGGEDAIAATNIYRTFSMCWALFNHYLLQSFEIDSIIIIFIDEGIEAKRSNLLQGRKQPGDGQRMNLSIDLSGSDPELLTLLLVCSLLKERGVERDPEPIVNGVPCLVTDCFWSWFHSPPHPLISQVAGVVVESWWNICLPWLSLRSPCSFLPPPSPAPTLWSQCF